MPGANVGKKIFDRGVTENLLDKFNTIEITKDLFTSFYSVFAATKLS